MSGLLRRAMHSQKAELRHTVMHMIVDGWLWRLSYLLAEQTLDGATRFRADAASALHQLAQVVDQRQPPVDPSDVQHLITALIDAAQGDGHHQAVEIVESLLRLCPRRIQHLSRLLDDDQAPLYQAMRQFVAHSHKPLALRALIPESDFLAGVLGLGWRERWLLIRIARAQQLPSPLTLLFSKTTLLIHAQGYAATFGQQRRERVMQRVANVAEVIYGSSG